MIYLNGISCLRCLKGWYDGYDGKGKTQPCQFCGHQAPAKMTKKSFEKIVHDRDYKIK